MIVVGCQNPFSPKVDFSDTSQGSGLADLKTIDGVFQNLQYAYTFRDTTIYSLILNEDFLFTYRDYDLGFDVTWSRQEEMKVTYGLFRNAERLDLIWNNVVLSSTDTTTANVIRGFNLTVTFNPSDIVRLNGRVNLTLQKNIEGNWQVKKWLDESNF